MKRCVPGVAFGQLVQDLPHGGLHLRIERIVVRSHAVIGSLEFPPRASLTLGQVYAVGVVRAAANPLFQFDQRGRELDGGDEFHALPVKQPEQHLQDVLAHGILTGAEESPRVVLGSRCQREAGIDRAALAGHANDRSVVSHMFEILDQSLAALVERDPIPQAASRSRVRRFRGREIFRKERLVEVGGQQSCRTVACRGRRWLRAGSVSGPAYTRI